MEEKNVNEQTLAQEELNVETEIVVEQETQPEQTEETKTEKMFTQAELDAIIEKRLARERDKVTTTETSEEQPDDEKTEYERKISELNLQKDNLSKEYKAVEQENLRLKYGIQQDKLDEVLALKDFRMSKDETLTESEAINQILGENTSYKDTLQIDRIGFHIANEPVAKNHSAERYGSVSVENPFLPQK